MRVVIASNIGVSVCDRSRSARPFCQGHADGENEIRALMCPTLEVSAGTLYMAIAHPGALLVLSRSLLMPTYQPQQIESIDPTPDCRARYLCEYTGTARTKEGQRHTEPVPWL